MKKKKLKMSNRRFIAIMTPILAILLVLIIFVTTALNSMTYFLDTFIGKGARTVYGGACCGYHCRYLHSDLVRVPV